MDTQSFFAYPNGEVTTRELPAVLGDLSDHQWQVLLAFTTTRLLRPGEVLCAEGVHDRALYILVGGRLDVHSHAGSVATLDPPAIIGELAFLDGGTQVVTARAPGDAEVLRLAFDSFESLGARDPHLAARFALDLGAVIAARLRADEQV